MKKWMALAALAGSAVAWAQTEWVPGRVGRLDTVGDRVRFALVLRHDELLVSQMERAQ